MKPRFYGGKFNIISGNKARRVPTVAKERFKRF